MIDRLTHPILCDASDGELAAELGVSVARIRHLRDRLRMDLDVHEVRLAAREVADLIDWEGGLSDLVIGVLRDYAAQLRVILDEPHIDRRDGLGGSHRLAPRRAGAARRMVRHGEARG